MRNRILAVLGAAAAIYLLRNLYVILLQLPDEAAQGAIYRIFFFHLPPYFAGVSLFFSALVASILYLWKKNFTYDCYAVSAIEVGLAFTAMNLVTGMIWGRIIWGIWWTWDARLTSALITWLIYAGYLMLRKAIPEPTERAKNSAVLAIFSFTAVYFTYKANEWYRTQHPGPVLTIRGADGALDPRMEWMILHNFIAFLLIAIVIVSHRMTLERNQREVEALRRYAHAQ